MMKFSELSQSNWLKKEDVGAGTLLTIRGFEEANIALEGEKTNMRWVMFFEEVEKGLVLNTTNGQILASIFGTDQADECVGQKVVLYTDPNVSFGGKLVGGIRIRAPKGTGVARSILKPIKGNNRPKPTMTNEEEDEDQSVPF
jgi:hypothetical protein